MKRNKIFILLLSLSILAFALLGCAKTDDKDSNDPTESAQMTQPTEQTDPTVESNDFSITVVDMMGREITLDEPATKVVALTAADCEILYAIGAGDTLVGRGEYCDYPEEVLEVPAVESGADTNLEQIIDLRPQILLMSTMAQTEEQIAALEAAGIKVVVSDAKDIEGVYESITLIGALMDREDEAKELIGSMRESFAEISSQSGGYEDELIYFEVSPLEYGLWTAGSDTFMNEIVEMIGLKNCFADIDGWAEVSEEQVLERDPDYIVTIAMYFGEGPEPDEEIKSRAGWENLTAIKNDAVLSFQNDELSRPGPRLAEGAKMLYEFVSEATAEEAPSEVEDLAS